MHRFSLLDIATSAIWLVISSYKLQLGKLVLNSAIILE